MSRAQSGAVGAVVVALAVVTLAGTATRPGPRSTPSRTSPAPPARAAQRGTAGLAAADTSPNGAPSVGMLLVRWTPPALATAAYESSPTFTPDGRELYFMRADPGFRRYRLLWSRCTGGGWSAPAPVPFAAAAGADGAGVDDADPSVTPDGRRLYFVSTRPAPARAPGAGDFDVWAVDRRPDGRWGAPWRLPAPVNTPGSELLPRPGPGGALYLGSDRPGGYGRSDIYVATRAADGRWAVANLGPPVSTPADEYEADVSRDGRTLVVVADRGDKSHLYLYARGGQGPGGDRWRGLGRVAARADVFQVGPLLSPGADRLLFAQADRGAGHAAEGPAGQGRSGEIFLTDLAPSPDRTWPPACPAAPPTRRR